jgi:hypothetical protein
MLDEMDFLSFAEVSVSSTAIAACVDNKAISTK